MTDTPATPTYDPGVTYDARVSRPVQVGNFRYLPRHSLRATGEMLNRIAEEHGQDAIASAVPR